MNKYEKLRALFRSNHPYRTNEIIRLGIPTQALIDLTRNGEIKHVTRGVYINANAPMTEVTNYKILAQAIPQGVLCLTSALKFHKLIKRTPDKTHMAGKRYSRLPRVDYPETVFHALSYETYDLDIDIYPEDDIAIQVYSIEKTIADCFKFRDQLGLKLPVDALKTAVKQNRINYGKLWDITGICGVRRIVDECLEILGVV